MVSIYSQNGEVEYKIVEYVLDSVTDLADLHKYDRSTGVGSTALIIETSEVYMLNGQREWVKL